MPEYLSSDARNLISRMLIVDPVKRIKMPEIMKHPWFLSIPPKTPYLPAALETVGVKFFIIIITIYYLLLFIIIYHYLSLLLLLQ